jgi:hypothetical protein
MNDFEGRLRAAVRENAEAARQNLGSHPSRDELIAYHQKNLTPEEADRVRDHLVACSVCRGALLCFDDLLRPEPAAEPLLSEFELATAWRGFRERLRPKVPRWLPAVAAMLLVGIAALSYQSIVLQRELEELSQPQLNTPVFDLLPRDTVYLGQSNSAEIELPSTVRFFTLVLNSGVRRSYRDYAVEISRAGGRRIYEGQGLQRNAFGSFTLTLARRMMEPGEYRIRLFGLEGGQKEPIGEYVLRIAAR